jgi:putative flippase GtrA
MYSLLLTILKFATVGSLGVIIDFLTTFILKDKLKVHKYLANSIGFFLAATNNYILNRSWTFKNNDPDIAAQYITFLLVSIGGLIFNNATIWYLNDKRNVNFWIAKFAAVIVAMFWNFFGYKFLAFR